MKEAQKEYSEQKTQIPKATNFVLRIHIFNILIPTYAVYKAFLKYISTENALLMIQNILSNMLRPFRKVLEWLSLKSSFNKIFNWLLLSGIKLIFPPSGWEIEWVQKNHQLISFRINNCIYLQTLTTLGAPELTPIFCWLDNYMFENLSPQLLFQRPKTLACHSEACIFNFEFKSNVQ
ncbi:MAG: L-2-amino-thiazoline-4-carboxylic acid hydrolase [Anaerolineaceae bacterium]|nr:L-2-amino-thiazoline-4-carboxylic acid hydrolase [Anaerolineaceae bacterium]